MSRWLVLFLGVLAVAAGAATIVLGIRTTPGATPDKTALLVLGGVVVAVGLFVDLRELLARKRRETGAKLDMRGAAMRSSAYSEGNMRIGKGAHIGDEGPDDIDKEQQPDAGN